jgi:hypothetical protein
MDGTIRLSLSGGSDTTRILMDAATDLRPLDVGRARDALLGALIAAVLVETMPTVFEEIARLARVTPLADESSPSTDDLLLDGSASLIAGDPVVGAPLLRRASQGLVRSAPNPQTTLRAFTHAAIYAYVLIDAAAIDSLTDAWITVSRQRGDAEPAFPSRIIDRPARCSWGPESRDPFAALHQRSNRRVSPGKGIPEARRQFAHPIGPRP